MLRLQHSQSLQLMLILAVFLVLSSMSIANDDSISKSGGQGVTKIVLLGTGTPNADPERSGPAVAIVVNDTPYLVDCGPGIVRRAAAAFESGVAGLKVENLKRLFVTHLHSDHTAGYSDLILTPWVLGRDEPLEVYGPEGIGEMTEHILAAYEQDIRVRLDGLEPINDSGYRVNTHDIKPGIIYQDTNVTVEALAVKHGSWPEAYGFIFTTPDRKIVISGDAVPSESIVEKCDGCDVLIHEVYSAVNFEKRSPVWKQYHSSSHTSTFELAELASRAKPALLILYHQLYWGATDEELLSEIREGYNGEVVSGKDLDVF
ncbi:MAG: MBL fold metallo-hydrolase [FCB group bacterium]|nr:MBL fold metallo-hydrolase [FCB group bacterium]